MQHIVFRLADAIPPGILAGQERAPADTRLAIVEAILRAGHGERLLSDPRVSVIVEDALLHFDGGRYILLAWCVMPTHVHALVEQIDGYTLSSVVHSWKSFSSTSANRRLGRRGALWAPEYYDRYMRDEAQVEATRAYIESNPVVAGLCARPEDWRYSSAWDGIRAAR